MWKRLVYYPNPIKTHVVHESVADIVIRNVEANHGFSPEEIHDEDSLRIDLGGMISMRSEPMSREFDGVAVEVKPEHILGAIIRWDSHRNLDESLESGENIVKVYLSEYLIAVVPESLYNDVGCWLALSKGEGYAARMEIVEALQDAPNIIVVPPPAEGEA